MVVDDDENDRLLMRLAIEQSRRTLPVLEFSDGQELIGYLSEDTSARPDQDMHWLVIMDVNMPRMDGLDALQTLRQDPHWAKLPVLILSTADDAVTRQISLKKGANGYLVKPTSLQEYGPLFDQHFAPWLAIDYSQWPDYKRWWTTRPDPTEFHKPSGYVSYRLFMRLSPAGQTAASQNPSG